MSRNVKISLSIIFLISINLSAQSYGSFTDTRDDKTYKTIQIGEQVWMAENLKFWVPEDSPHYVGKSYYYEGLSENYHKYGRLYPWETACKACPEGWHLPSKNEWLELINSYEHIYEYNSNFLIINVPKDLPKKERRAIIKSKRKLAKETSLKLQDGGSSGFNVLYGGFKDPNAYSFDLNVKHYFNLGTQGHFWTSDDDVEQGVFKNIKAFGFEFIKFGKTFQIVDKRKSLCFSVRCIKDSDN